MMLVLIWPCVIDYFVILNTGVPKMFHCLFFSSSLTHGDEILTRPLHFIIQDLHLYRYRFTGG